MKNGLRYSTGLARKNGHVLLLLTLVVLMFVASFQPSYYMAGWDNFSASLDPGLNLKRGVLPTWREYRGMGVQSDSEVTDCPRQVLFTLLASIIPRETLDQLYLFVCLAVGIFSMYKLAQLLLPNYGTGNKNASLVASLFYLFNLNTLTTFFNPMVMYVTRFALLPTLVLTFYKALKEPSAKNLLYFSLTSFLLGSSFVTATVFITVLLLLLIITTSRPKTVNVGSLLVLLTLCINGYWLGVFFDYTLNKSTGLTKTSTYVEINEIQQNRSPMDFSWQNILILRPDLQSAEPTKIIDGTKAPLHPTLNFYGQKPFYTAVSFVFPFLFTAGLILSFIKREHRLLWASITVTLFILLARKTLPPLGFLYAWLTKHLPLLDVIFRFPDTKYYPLIAFAGALLAGYMLLNIFCVIKKPILQKAIVGMITLLNLVAFYPYFTGWLVNPTMFVKIPGQYFKVAEAVNTDVGIGRLVHLPNEKISYWKSYMWGYMGSDFLGYMLKKPIIDRTYEPASPENDEFNRALYELSKNPDNANLIAGLFERADVKYVLWDETVNPLVYSRGRKYWGTFNHDMYKETVNSLEEGGYLKPTYLGKVDITQYLDIYRDREKLHPDLIKYLTENKYLETTLYETQGSTNSNFQSLEKAEYVSNVHNNLLETPFLVGGTSWVQKQANKDDLLYPFYLKNLSYSRTDNLNAELLGMFSNNQGNLTVTPTKNNQAESAISIKTKRIDQTLIFGFFLHSPFGKETLIKELSIPLYKLDLEPQGAVNDYASDWWTLPFTQVSNSRLALNKTVVPLPPLSFYQNFYQDLATVLTENITPTVSIFTKKTVTDLSLWDFELTDKPDCYKDMYPHQNYLSELNKVEGNLTLTTENGSSCITNPIKEPVSDKQVIVDIKPNYKVSVISKKEESDTNNTPTYKYVSSLPNYSYIDFCFINTADGGCLNNHRTLKLGDQQSYIIPQTTLDIESKTVPQIVMSTIPVGLQRIDLDLNAVQQISYQQVYSDTLTINPEVETYQVQSTSNLQIPRILAPDSYYFNDYYDAYLTYNQPCQESGGYRTTKKLNDGVITYLNQCDHGIGLSLNYNPQGFYLWALEYNLLSGKNPKFTLSDEKNEFKDEYVLLNTESFPNIPKFKWIQNQPYNKDEKGLIDKAPYKTAYTYIYPNTAKAETKNQFFSITQNSRNEGIIKYKSMDIIRLPNSWAGTRLEYGNPRITYSKLDIKQIKKYLPSFWKIEVTPNLWTTKNGPYLIEFNQAYDKNWKLYKNIWGVIFGTNEFTTDHVKINGLTNGWEIGSEQLKKSGNTVIYVFYTPERLGVGGWLITISTFITLVILVVRKKQINKTD